MDQSYSDILKLSQIINLKQMFLNFDNQFKGISSEIGTVDPKVLIADIKSLSKELMKIPDNRNLISKLNKVSRSLKKKKIDYNRVIKDFNDVYSKYKQKRKEIKPIDKNIALELSNYLNAVSSSIGVRQQNKIPRELALYLASCRSTHKDLSLYF